MSMWVGMSSVKGSNYNQSDPTILNLDAFFINYPHYYQSITSKLRESESETFLYLKQDICSPLIKYEMY